MNLIFGFLILSFFQIDNSEKFFANNFNFLQNSIIQNIGNLQTNEQWFQEVFIKTRKNPKFASAFADYLRESGKNLLILSETLQNNHLHSTYMALHIFANNQSGLENIKNIIITRKQKLEDIENNFKNNLENYYEVLKISPNWKNPAPISHESFIISQSLIIHSEIEYLQSFEKIIDFMLHNIQKINIMEGEIIYNNGELQDNFLILKQNYQILLKKSSQTQLLEKEKIKKRSKDFDELLFKNL